MTLKMGAISSWPSKGTSLCRNMSYDVYIVKIGKKVAEILQFFIFHTIKLGLLGHLTLKIGYSISATPKRHILRNRNV